MPSPRRSPPSAPTFTLVSGPVSIPDPMGMHVVHVERADEMRDAVLSALPADIAVMVAAVADWRVASAADQKIKKHPGESIPTLALTENPDILKTVGHHTMRPKLVIGFAAETQDVEVNARAKLERKGADMIVANDVSPATGIMGGTRNRVKLIRHNSVEQWPDLEKDEVAARLAALIAEAIQAGIATAFGSADARILRLEGRDLDAHIVDQYGTAIRNFRPSIDVVVQRLRHEAIADADGRGIKRRRLTVGGVAHCMQRLPIGESGREAHQRRTGQMDRIGLRRN